MSFKTTVATDRWLREQHELRLFEIYHENSKLHFETASRSFHRELAPSQLERFLTTRGFRDYRSLTQIVLPPPLSSRDSVSDVMLRRRSRRDLDAVIQFGELATLLTQSLGVTAIVEDSESNLLHGLRAWPSAGGLYPLDAYAVVTKVLDIQPGLYHYNPIRSTIDLLVSREVQHILSDGFFNQPFAKDAALALLFVASFERTVAKYGERGYRLVLLDAGHAAQNLILTAEQIGLPAVAVAGFNDDKLAADLGLDGISDSIVHTVLVGGRK